MTKYLSNSRILALTLFISDIIGFLLCFELSFRVRFSQSIDWSIRSWYGLIALVFIGLYLADAYQIQRRNSTIQVFLQAVLSIFATGAIAVVLIYWAAVWDREPLFGRGILLAGLSFFTVWVGTSRTLAKQWEHSRVRKTSWLLVGGGEAIASIWRDLRAWQPQSAICLLLDDPQDQARLSDQGLPILKNSLQDLELVAERGWSGVIIAASTHLSESTLRQLMQMRLSGVQIYRPVDFYEQFWGKTPTDYLQDDWFAFASGFGVFHHRIHVKLKRLVDIVGAVILLPLLVPLCLLIALAIRLEGPGPILYSQVRTGLNREPFYIYKFRSMGVNAEQQGIQWACKRDPRITKVGYWLRLMRLDELPQLWNVLRGDMSLIGPRPERPEFDELLSQQLPYYDVRYLVKPGITGWAQVMYYYGASVDDARQKLAYDLYYIKNYSLFLDLEIAFKTFRVMLLGKGR